jgi:hypothetical protein
MLAVISGQAWGAMGRPGLPSIAHHPTGIKACAAQLELLPTVWLA